MYVEDFVFDIAEKILYKKIIFNNWDENFVLSIMGHIQRNRPLSTKQASTIQTITERYKKPLLQSGITENIIQEILSFPRYKQQPYESINIPNEVRYIGDNKLAFRFKPTSDLIQHIKETRVPFRSPIMPVFNSNLQLWIISVTLENYSKIMNLISYFNYDDVVIDYLTLCENSKTENSTFFVDDKHIVANITCDDILDSWVRRVVYGEIA